MMEQIFTPGFDQLLIAIVCVAWCIAWIKWAPGRF